MISENDGKFLLKLARDCVEKFAKEEPVQRPENYPEALNENMGLFCTINKKDSNNVYQLRGCIGIPYPTMPLIDAVISAAQSTCEDPRFDKLCEDELPDIKIEVSVLTEPKSISIEGIEPGKHGLILQYGPYSGLFLPQVWKQLPEKEQFLDNLCLKAGLTPGMWKENGVKLYSFEAQVFEE